MTLIPENQTTTPSDINKALIDLNTQVGKIVVPDTSMLYFFATGNADMNTAQFDIDMNASPLLLDLQGALGA